MQALKVLIATAALLSFTAACHRHTPEDAAVPANKPLAQIQPINQDGNKARLTAEIAKIQPDFVAGDETLSRRIDGLSLDPIAKSSRDIMDGKKGNESLVAIQTGAVKGSVLVKGMETPIAFQSDTMDFTLLGSGQSFDLILDDQMSMSQSLGGLLSLKGRCVDRACNEIAIWLMSFQGEKLLTAGYILGNVSDIYVIENSLNADTLSVVDAIARASSGRHH